MKFRILLLATLFFSLLVTPLNLCAQGVIPVAGQENTQEAEPDSVRITPFASSGITEAFSATNKLLSESGNLQLTEEQIASFISEADTLFSFIGEFLADSVVISLEGISVRELDNITQRANFYLGKLKAMEKRMSDQATRIEEAVLLLATGIERWKLTVETIPDEDIPEERMKRINRSIFQLDSVQVILKENIGIILVQQDRFVGQESELEKLMVRVREKKTMMGESLTRREMPGFFKDLSTLKDSTLVQKHIISAVDSINRDWKIMKNKYIDDLVLALAILLILLILAIWYKRNQSRMIDVDHFKLSETHLTFISVPGATVIFLVTLLIRFFLPLLPHTFFALNLFIMMVPMTILATKLFGIRIRAWTIVLLVLYTLVMAYELAYNLDIILRILLLGFSITALWLFIWVLVKRPFADKFSSNFIGSLFRLLIFAFIILLVIAIFANLVGAFQLAEFFTILPVQITVLAIGIQVASKLADALIYLFLASNFVQRANVIRDEFDTIYKKCSWLTDVFLWLFFFVAALNVFRVKEVVFDWGRRVLTNGIQLGNVDISLGNILIFFFVIWLSIMITRIVKSVLEKDVFTRMEMAKGVPSTVILLVRIVLITGGFFLAAAAAGMELTNLSIVLGAFSVGIGFGLQNIFNNMVSGLILAFERPIKVGDVVQVGELMGTVRVIGLRSSTIRSFDGSEVIVPNGNLISDQMINWTLSDSNRRMDIRVGVAYGTDPEKVLNIMEGVAAEHTGVRKKPLPRAYFIEFGDSSLNFRLLAWAHLDIRLEVESEIYVSINRELDKAGIEIPFPQTDLHIRSDDTKAKETAPRKPAAKKPAATRKPPGKGNIE